MVCNTDVEHQKKVFDDCLRNILCLLYIVRTVTIKNFRSGSFLFIKNVGLFPMTGLLKLSMFESRLFLFPKIDLLNY